VLAHPFVLGPGWSGPWPAKTGPAWFTPTRIACTPTQFYAIMASLRSGDVVEVKPMTLSGEVVINAKPSRTSSIFFDSGVRFTGTGPGTRLPAVWLSGANLDLYGGDVSGLGNDCIRISAGSNDTTGPTNLRWWGVRAHDCGGTGLSVFGTSLPTVNLDISAEIWNVGLDLSLDPHPEKGAGLHAAYLGGGNAATSGQFAIYAHDTSNCSGDVQIGSMLQNAQVWVRARNLSWRAEHETGGNAIQIWGDQNQDDTIQDVEAQNITGHVVETGGMWQGDNANIVVKYGRGSFTLLNPREGTKKYVPFPAVAYQNVDVPSTTATSHRSRVHRVSHSP
jgi:hypothetical protein